MSRLDLKRPHSQLAASLVIAAALLAAFIAPSEPAHAHFESGAWSHDDWRCSYELTRQDPISIFFYGWGYADRSVDSVKYHFGWGNGELGQYFASHGNCLTTSHASEGPAPEGQYHIRIKKTWDEDWQYNVTSAATPHQEVGCGVIGGGHGVLQDGFRSARDRVIDGIWWRADHGFGGWQLWGNTAMRDDECDLWWATFDGNVGWLYQHYSFHQ